MEVVQQVGGRLPASEGAHLLEMRVRRPDGLDAARGGRAGRVRVSGCPRPSARVRVGRAACEPGLDFALFSLGDSQLVPYEEEGSEEGEDGGEDVHDQRTRQGGVRELARCRLAGLITRVWRCGAEKLRLHSSKEGCLSDVVSAEIVNVAVMADDER